MVQSVRSSAAPVRRRTPRHRAPRTSWHARVRACSRAPSSLHARRRQIARPPARSRRQSPHRKRLHPRRSTMMTFLRRRPRGSRRPHLPRQRLIASSLRRQPSRNRHPKFSLRISASVRNSALGRSRSEARRQWRPRHLPPPFHRSWRRPRPPSPHPFRRPFRPLIRCRQRTTAPRLGHCRHRFGRRRRPDPRCRPCRRRSRQRGLAEKCGRLCASAPPQSRLRLRTGRRSRAGRWG
jgi:hypothetical protein